MARWVRRRDKARRVRAIASQQRGAFERFGVTREEAERSAWTIDAERRRLEGAAAINRVLAELGGPWPGVAAVYRIPPIAVLEEVSYRWFARNRFRFQRFGTSPECDDPSVDCR